MVLTFPLGVAVIIAPEEALKVTAGDQVYVSAPLALIVVEVPEQIVKAFAVATTLGMEFTTRVSVSVPLHPSAEVPVKVKVVVAVGLARTVPMEISER